MLITYERHSKRKLTATIISILVVAGVVLFADHIKAAQGPGPHTVASSGRTSTTSTGADEDTPTTTSSSGGSASNSGSTSGYKDGSYTASSSYYVPHANESIQVRLTLQNGTITNASIQNSESNRDSAMFQEDFASAYKSYVVGKKISGLQLGVVAGASDTTQGFNDALSQIASQAQS